MIPTSTVSRSVEIGLHLTGIWPNSSIFFKLLWILVMGIGLIFQYYYLLTHFSTKELPNLIDGLSTTLPHSLLFFKLIVLWVNHRIFKNILTAMSNDWHKYSNMYAMIDKAVLAHRCSKLIISVYSIAVLLYSTASINLNKQSDDDCRELLIKMELPFGFCESPIYEIVMFVQFVRLMASKTIGDAVYGSVWYNLKPQDSRILLFVIMRSQRRLTITAGKFMDLSLEGFANYWWLIIHLGTDDMSHLMDGLSVTMEYSVMFLKLIILWLNSCIFYDILAAMAADWRKAAISEIHTMRNKANLSRHFSNVIIGLHSAAAFSYGIGVLVSHSNDYDIDGDKTPAREFTLKLQLPFESDESPRYELVMCLEFCHQLASSAMTGVLNSLIVTLILHASGQIEILCDALRDVSSDKNNQRFVTSIMKELIGKHQKIIVFSDQIEKIFCYIALIQFLSSSLVICCLGFMISISTQDTIDSSSLMKAIVFYMAATVEAFIFCFCGEYLSAKSKMISDAAYESIWYDFKPNECKLILFIILRSQRRLTITAGKIMDLSLEGFTSGVASNLHVNILKLILWEVRAAIVRKSCQKLTLVVSGFVNEEIKKREFLCEMIPTSTVSRPVEIGLRLTGIWPNSLIFFRLLWTLVMGTALIFQYHYLLVHFSIKELPNLIDGLSTTLPYNLLFFKLIALLFIDILTAMSNDWSEYSNMYTMIDKAILAQRCSKVTIGVYSTAVLLYSTASINFRKQTNGSCRELLIKMELPFEFCNSPIYEIVECVQFVHLMAIASAIGMLDALMVTLMLHIGGQIDLMHQEVEEICPKNNKYNLPATILRSLINKHQKIIAFSENIEGLFSHIALMQFFSNTLIICCIGFLIVTSMGTDEGVKMLVKTLFFYLAITLEVFIFCFAGEYLSNKSRTIGDAVYESVWYTLKPQDCRILLLIIMRSQRRLTITAGKFMDLSLEGFTNVRFY
ncbi:OR4 protein, partial [Pseudoatta argentina]